MVDWEELDRRWEEREQRRQELEEYYRQQRAKTLNYQIDLIVEAFRTDPLIYYIFGKTDYERYVRYIAAISLTALKENGYILARYNPDIGEHQ